MAKNEAEAPNHRLAEMLAYADARLPKLVSERRKHLFTKDTSKAANAKRVKRPTKTMRVHEDAACLASTAWPDSSERIAAISDAIWNAAESRIRSLKTYQNHS